MSEDLLVDSQDKLRIVTLNRPQQRNALTLKLWHELFEQITVFAESADRLMILRGAGEKAFAAGSDIRELPQVYKDPETSAAYDKTLLMTQKHLADCAKPTIAMIYGHCTGGGLGLATACDFRFAASNAVLAAPPAKLGLVYGVSATRRLMQLIGPSRTREMLYSARSLSAAEAWHMGLVDQVFEKDDLERETRKFADGVMSNSQFSVRASKRVIDRILNGEDQDDEFYWSLVKDAVTGEDFAEGLDAFLNKRKAKF